jgi:hypothetical protein
MTSNTIRAQRVIPAGNAQRSGRKLNRTRWGSDGATSSGAESPVESFLKYGEGIVTVASRCSGVEKVREIGIERGERGGPR